MSHFDPSEPGRDVWIDPAASTTELAIGVSSDRKSTLVILSRREAARLAHQLQRWLEWDRPSQGTPRMYILKAKDLYPAVAPPRPNALPEEGCGTAREAPTASVSADAQRTHSVAPQMTAETAATPPVPLMVEAPAIRPAPQLARRPKIDISGAPSSMEQSAAGWRG